MLSNFASSALPYPTTVSQYCHYRQKLLVNLSRSKFFYIIICDEMLSCNLTKNTEVYKQKGGLLMQPTALYASIF